MKVIVKPAGKISKTWGSPSVKDNDYRLILYHLSTEVEEGTLLHNNVTGEMVLLEGDEAVLLNKLPLKDDESELFKELVAKHFLVPTDFDERKSVTQLRRVLRIMQAPKNITGYTILPTTSCNARCFYCYEAGYPHHTMTEDMAHKTVEYIEKHCGEEKKVSLSWFGGEPLVGEIRIDQICNELTKKGIEYKSSMISNGYLFTEEMVKKAKDLWKLNNIQITLDGTEEIYNKTKAYVGVKDNPYERVLGNIRCLIDNEIRVSVRMNLDRHNADNLYRLVDELSERFAENKFFSAYVHVLFDDCGFTPVEHTEADNEELMGIQIKLTDYIKSKKVSFGDKGGGLPSLKIFYCMADNFGSRLINPLGETGKCEHYIYEHKVGNVVDGDTDKDEMKYWTEFNEWEKCKTCPLYPKCFKPKGCQSQTACVGSDIKCQLSTSELIMKDVYNKKLKTNFSEDNANE